MIGMPTLRDWLFSVRTFATSILALYTALACGLPRPSWAMVTVYVVAHPLVGATRSKAAYRVGGTVLGAAAAVFLVPPLIDAPLLLALVVAAWSGTFLYLSMLDRSPSSYFLLLPAYTLPLIAWSAVGAPQSVFDTAVARSEEILLGIVCASIVGALVSPRRTSAELGARLDTWFKDAGDWAHDLLVPAASSPGAGRQHLIAADVIGIDQYLSHVAYDSADQGLVLSARELRSRMSMLPPLLASLSGVLQALRQQPGGVPATSSQLMHEMAAWMAGAPLAQGSAQLLARQGGATSPADWPQLLDATLCLRLLSLLHLWQDCLALRAMVAAEQRDATWQAAYRRWETGGTARHADRAMLRLSALTASLGMFLAGLLWIVTGLPQGGNTVTFVAVSCCIFAVLDEPVPRIRQLFTVNLAATALGGALLFAVVPSIHAFEMLVALLAIPCLLAGTLLMQAQWSGLAMLFIALTISAVDIQASYNSDFETFVNANLASALGVLLAMVWTSLTRPFGRDMALRRLLRANWRDLAQGAAAPHDYAQNTARMLDRAALLLPHLAAEGLHRLVDVFRQLRAGFGMLDLLRAEHRLPDAAQAHVNAVLRSASAHFAASASAGSEGAASDIILRQIDLALDATLANTSHAARQARGALVELRLSLFPTAGAHFGKGQP